MRIPRELPALLGIFLVLAVAALAIKPGAPEESPGPALSSYSAAPEGALALFLWLQSLGYRVERMEYEEFAPPKEAGVLLVLAPAGGAEDDDLDRLRRWVDDGGTLVLAGGALEPAVPLPGNAPFVGRNALTALMAKFELGQRRLGTPQREVAPTQPLSLNPFVGTARVEAESYVTGPAGLVAYLGPGEQPVAAGLAVGQGHVYVLADSFAWSNEGLGAADNAALLLNWLPVPEEAGTVVFDEVHHGLAKERSLTALAVRRPWGWAALFILGVLFLYLLLGGRRFGRAVKDVADGRRPAAEYVVALAALLRRADKREWAAGHYERALRRQLAESFELDPALEPEALARRLSELGPAAAAIDGGRVARTLSELRSGRRLGDRRLVRAVADCDAIIKACKGRRR